MKKTKRSEGFEAMERMTENVLDDRMLDHVYGGSDIGDGIMIAATEIRKCLAAGTQVTMADGTSRNIEDVKAGDSVMTFDHEAGCCAAQEVILAFKGDDAAEVFTLNFEDGTALAIAGVHDLFERESCKYVRISEDNAAGFIGKHFYSVAKKAFVQLSSVTRGTEKTAYYSIYTGNNLNSVANGMLSLPDDVDARLNIYEFGEDLKADAMVLSADFAKYGVYECPENTPDALKEFASWRGRYARIIVGKGLASDGMRREGCLKDADPRTGVALDDDELDLVQAGKKCFAAGTQVTMADGTSRNIEDVKAGDGVMTFDHEAGRCVAQEVILAFKGADVSTAFTLNFEDGTALAIAGVHDLFERESCRYVRISENNAEKFVGKHFYSIAKKAFVRLSSVTRGTEKTAYYSIYTGKNLNSIANGMLSLPDDVDVLLNVYEFGKDLKADAVALVADFAKFGELEYPANAPGSRERFASWRGRYGNIVLGKGLMTRAELADSIWKD